MEKKRERKASELIFMAQVVMYSTMHRVIVAQLASGVPHAIFIMIIASAHLISYTALIVPDPALKNEDFVFQRRPPHPMTAYSRSLR